MNTYNYTYDICGLVILIVIMLVHGRQKKVFLLQNRLFNCLLLVSFIATFVDLINYIIMGHLEEIPVWFLNLTSYIYIISVTLVSLLFALYSLSLKDNRIIKNQATLTFALFLPMIIVATMVIANPVNHLLFNFGLYRVRYRGKGMVLIYIICFFYIMFGNFYAIQNKKKISSSIRAVMFAFLVLGCGASLFQLYFPKQIVTCFGISICILLLYANIQKPDSLIDPIVGILNKNCFSKMFDVSGGKKSRDYAIIMCLEDIQIVNSAIGMEKMNGILRSIGEFLNCYKKVRAYYLNSGTFAVITDNENTRQLLLNDIAERFKGSWEDGDLSVNMSVRMLTVSIPDDASSFDDFYNYIDYLRGLDNSHSLQLSAKELHMDNSKRKVIVEKKIVEAIENESFQLFYQPIVSTETGKVVAAEALIRLYSDEYGFIPPDEFIPLAEKNGLILKIGDLVFKKVLNFMSKNKLQDLGVEFVDINLSVVQCMQEDMVGKLISLLDDYGINHDQVNLEITETAAANSPRILQQNMNELLKHGIHFSLDDFGTGYSNMSYILDLPFNLIKFDKLFVDKASTTEKGKIMLESSASMIKKLNLKIVAEGVETERQCDMLKSLGIEYLQGYYFSKPIPGNEFIHFVNRFNGNV